mgnify:FL=1|jgi:hypothetical protein
MRWHIANSWLPRGKFEQEGMNHGQLRWLSGLEESEKKEETVRGWSKRSEIPWCGGSIATVTTVCWCERDEVKAWLAVGKMRARLATAWPSEHHTMNTDFGIGSDHRDE